MDQVKIGKFIASCRKANNITQQTLADSLGVSFKTVSNWENGRNMPDVSLFKPLCEQLGIKVNELLNGEDDITDNGLVDYIRYQNKKNRLKLIISGIVIFLIVLLSVLSIFFVNNYKNVNVYILSGASDNFEYRDGLLILSNIKNINKTGRLDIKNNSIKSSDIKCLALKYKDKNISRRCGAQLDGIDYEANGYNEYFPEEVKNGINDWYIEVSYIQKDVEKKEIIKLNANHILTNSGLFYKKAEPISDGEDATTYIENTREYHKNVWNELLNTRGFKDDGVFDINGNPKKDVLLHKKVGDKYIKYHHDSDVIEILGKNKERMYANLIYQFVNFNDGTGKGYVYDILKNQVIKCNGKKCNTIDSETEKIIQEYKALIFKEFDGLLNFNPDARYIDPNDEEDM